MSSNFSPQVRSAFDKMVASAQVPVSNMEPDALIGLFQRFRPDGRLICEIFENVPGGEAFAERLKSVYEVCGEPMVVNGGRDAYFIVHRPPLVESGRAEQIAGHFFENLAGLAAETGHRDLYDRLTPLPRIRVLEGIPPKHPRAKQERSDLLNAVLESGPQLTETIEQSSAEELSSEFANLLRPACYFIACDPFLRDYLIWPWLAEQSYAEDPFAPYFFLWRHRIKYRIFGEHQIDVYLPRENP